MLRVRPVDPAQQDTLDFAATETGGASAATVGLTLLAHPNSARIGEVAPLFSLSAGGARRVSRLELEFGAPGSSVTATLGTPVLSRKPTIIKTTIDGKISVESEADRVNVEGRPLGVPVTFDLDQLRQGITLDLAGCVLLLLHLVPTEADELVSHQGIFGDSLAIRRVRAEIAKVADLDTSVLIRGESGAGKELVARAIHTGSTRAARSYVAVNAAAIPNAMAASALFGHAKGAFTGAAAKSVGFFGEAEGGTLFLDEIGEVPREVQVLLLRAIRENEVQPVGEPRPRKCDVRLVTATDADLEALAERGEFSLPLLRRIEAYSLTIPPLRARRDDVARLFVHFLRAELSRLGESAKLDEQPAPRKPWLPSHFIRALVGYEWPGNVAELQTVARRLAIINRGQERFIVDDWLGERLGLEQPGVSRRPAFGSAPAARRDPRDISDEEIVVAMQRTQFKVNATAEVLGVSRSWLHTRLEFCQGLRKAKELTAAEISDALLLTDQSVADAAAHLQVSEHGLKLRMAALGIGK